MESTAYEAGGNEMMKMIYNVLKFLKSLNFTLTMRTFLTYYYACQTHV